MLLGIMKGDAIKRYAPYYRIGSDNGRLWLNAPPG